MHFIFILYPGRGAPNDNSYKKKGNVTSGAPVHVTVTSGYNGTPSDVTPTTNPPTQAQGLKHSRNQGLKESRTQGLKDY